MLQEEWSCQEEAFTFTAPRGWESDLASIPAPLRRWTNAFALGVRGPLAHDFIYDDGGAPRRGVGARARAGVDALGRAREPLLRSGLIPLAHGEQR